MKKRLLSMLVCFCMVITMLTMAAMPVKAVDEGDYSHDITIASLYLKDDVGTLKYSTDGTNWIDYSGDITVTGSTEENRIIVTSGSHNITLNGAIIDASQSSAFDIQGFATVNLFLMGENKMKSSSAHAGLHVDTNASIIIDGDGSLEAIGGVHSAGIGGNGNSGCGTITITGGNINATGGVGGGSAAGIGGADGYYSNSGDITITGGKIFAQGSINGSGIGKGGTQYGNTGNIMISGGFVTARGGYGYDDITIGIGGAGGGEKGVFSTGSNGNAFIVTDTISDNDDKSAWSGIIMENNDGQVYGNSTLTMDIEISADQTLTIDDGKSLTIDAGITLNNSGTLKLDGTIVGPGSLAGNGMFITGNLTSSDIEPISDYDSTGSGVFPVITFNKKTYMGKEFTINADSWTKSFEKKDGDNWIEGEVKKSGSYRVKYVKSGKEDAVKEFKLDSADYSKVDEAIKTVNTLNKDFYMDFSAVTAAVEAVVRDKNFTEQAEVTAMATAIEDAIRALELKGADYSEVDEAIEIANAINKDYYKDFSAVTAAVEAVVRDKKITEQAEVTAMATAIKDAIKALELKDADYSKVDEAIETANALDKDYYKDFSAVTAAVEAVVRNKKIIEQTEVNAMVSAIEDAIKALELKGADYSKVDEAIKVVHTLNKDYYKDFSTVTAAVEAVVRDKKITEQVEVTAMATAIEDAIKALELKGADYSKVDEAIKAANALNKNHYKDFSTVTTAMNAVVRNKDITKQAEVTAMATAIEDAIKALELKGADYSKVDEVIKIANSLNKDRYKDFSAVTAAVNAVVRNKDITKQAEVTVMAIAIEDAIKALELKSASPTRLDTDSPVTGDANGNIIFWITSMLISGGAMILLVTKKNKKLCVK